jgi:hypothetical protein
VAEWGNPVWREPDHRGRKALRRTRGTETSQYPEEEKSTERLLVAASERGHSPNRLPCGGGVVGSTDGHGDVNRSALERAAKAGESPVDEDKVLWLVAILSSARHEKPGVKLGGR